ncbi:hypothetical protein MVEN_01633700 [Mycena venus]|uniref:Uncharacterized protein n=1 Tax=Mycena venus TaxID=2733690 RepID=A0A8H6XN03_9AGAR|nr:hypothetical protein MVEN_01633700 [Mycena venus]
MAQALADASNFPVIVYSSDEDPTLGFDAEDADLIEAFNTLAEEDTVDANETTDGNSHSGDEGKLCELAPGDGGNDPGGRRDSQGPPGGGGEGLPGGGGGDEGPPGGGGGGEGPPGRGGGGEGPSGGGDSGEGPPGGGDGGNPDSGGAGPGADEDPWGDWEDGPTHLTSLGIRLKFEKTVLVQVNCNTQFKTHEKPNPFLTPIHMEHEGATEKRQAEIHVGVIVQTPKMYVLVRRSFAVLGLLVDREDAIIQNSRINVGYSPPDQLLKEVSAENRQHQVGVNASYAGGHPTAGLSYAYTSGKTNTYETQNRTNLPPAEVLSDMGDIWEPEGKTYRSASYSYMSQGRGDPSNLSAGFGFGVDFSDSVSLEDVPLPRVSGVQRHQIFLWIRNPKAKSGVRVQGIIVLLNSIIPDIRRKSQLQWRAKFDVDATSGQASNAQRTSRAEGKSSLL